MNTSKNKIVWPDIEFMGSPIECMRDYAYHKRGRCSAMQEWEPGNAPPRLLLPTIHRYRVYINGKKMYDTVVCDACHVSVGGASRQRLEKGSKHEVDWLFGPHTKNARTDYYEVRSEPVGWPSEATVFKWKTLPWSSQIIQSSI